MDFVNAQFSGDLFSHPWQWDSKINAGSLLMPIHPPTLHPRPPTQAAFCKLASLPIKFGVLRRRLDITQRLICNRTILRIAVNVF